MITNDYFDPSRLAFRATVITVDGPTEVTVVAKTFQRASLVLSEMLEPTEEIMSMENMGSPIITE